MLTYIVQVLFAIQMNTGKLLNLYALIVYTVLMCFLSVFLKLHDLLIIIKKLHARMLGTAQGTQRLFPPKCIEESF